jgi:hypothetical protein
MPTSAYQVAIEGESDTNRVARMTTLVEDLIMEVRWVALVMAQGVDWANEGGETSFGPDGEHSRGEHS